MSNTEVAKKYIKKQGREAKREIKTGKCQIHKFSPKSAQKPTKTEVIEVADS